MNKKRKLLGFLSLLLGIIAVIVPNALALEIIISENGSGTSNIVETQVESTTTVEQNNEADVSNNVDTNANTGNNESSQNTGGDVEIATGDVIQEVAIETAVNFSEVEVGCCPDNTNLTIEGNGVESKNEIRFNDTGGSEIIVSQTANVSNKIDGTANTGDNAANDNTGGNVSIQTGDIFAIGVVDNEPINSAKVVGAGGGGDVSVKISENGANSNNSVSVNLVNISGVFQNFNAYLENFVNWDLNTGRNEASGNSGGDVNIVTGDIDLKLLVKNFVNIGEVDIVCCPFDPDDPGSKDPDGDGPPIGGPGDPGDGGGGGGSDNGGGDSGGSGGVVGGLEILGLSDTSSENAQTLFFFAGLAMILGGARILAAQTNGGKKKIS